ASPRAGIAVALFALYFCGYPAVQFHVRHFFHLEIVAWWALVFVGGRLLYGLWRFIQTGARPRLTRAHVRRAAVALAAIVVMTTVPVTGLRAYQQRHASTLLDAYVHAPRAPLPMTHATAGAPAPACVRG